ncbi:TRAP transporter large permease [Rhodoferax sp.]|uniref:TRAP transporter large permease n=1 Tax=Rhodoferax sp. TaxID=50421 RepID=UPI00274F3410|nr:TRAP transporter large permease subunit [Rhodoferax sp.]
MNAAIIFILLLVLMLTGMPISISLGLTVLTFLFGFTNVPLESVALKLFTGIEKFEIMAIPFFILAGNFLTHGGVARRMINFASSMVGHWYGGLGLAGVLACALFAAVFVYKDMRLKDVPRVLLNSANMSAMFLYIITNAVLFSFIMTNENIPQALADWMLGHGLGMITFLLAVNVILLLAGNFMEPSSIVLIFAPILFPVAMKLGIDPVHFGIIMVVNMEVGMCHPPVGLNLYVASGITKMGITELTVAVWPWLLAMLGFLMVVTYWPGLSLWFPRMLGMM